MKVPLLHSTATFCAMEVMEADGSSIIITNQEGYKSEGKYIYRKRQKIGEQKNRRFCLKTVILKYWQI